MRDLIRGLVNTRPLMAACGKRVEVELKAHFASRQAEGNKHGWADKQFWSGASTRSVSANVALQEAPPRLPVKAAGGRRTPKRFAHPEDAPLAMKLRPVYPNLYYALPECSEAIFLFVTFWSCTLSPSKILLPAIFAAALERRLPSIRPIRPIGRIPN